MALGYYDASENPLSLEQAEGLFKQELNVLGLKADEYKVTTLGRYGVDGFVIVANQTTGVRQTYQIMSPKDTSWMKSASKDIQLGGFHKFDEQTRSLNHTSHHKYLDNATQRSLALYQTKATNAQQTWEKSYDSVIAFANATLKMLALINGGALIALLPILNRLTDIPNLDNRYAPLQYFVAGVMLALFAYLCSYFAQYHYAQKRKSAAAERFRWGAIFAGLGSALLFAVGCENILSSVMQQPTLAEKLIILIDPFFDEFINQIMLVWVLGVIAIHKLSRIKRC